MENRIRIGLIGFLIVIAFCVGTITQLQSQNNLMKSIYKLEAEEMSFAYLTDDIIEEYSLASQYYDINEFNLVITYCEKSRDSSSEYSQKLRILREEIPKSNENIWQLKRDLIETEIEVYFALYEACEHFEAASRSYQSEKWSSGDVSIEMMNERIEDHDNLVEEYNTLLAKYNKEKGELFE